MSTIDESFAIPGFRAVEPVPVPYVARCRQCALKNDLRCSIAPCSTYERPDGRAVIMKAIEPSEETK